MRLIDRRLWEEGSRRVELSYRNIMMTITIRYLWLMLTNLKEAMKITSDKIKSKAITNILLEIQRSTRYIDLLTKGKNRNNNWKILVKIYNLIMQLFRTKNYRAMNRIISITLRSLEKGKIQLKRIEEELAKIEKNIERQSQVNTGNQS